MIYVNIFNITNNKKKIQVSVETLEGYSITSLKLWTNKTYKDPDKVVDLDYKIQNINNKEVFMINTSDLLIEEFSGIYFLEIKSNAPTDGCETCPQVATATTANFCNLKECMLNKALELNVCDSLFNCNGCNDNPGVELVNLGLIMDSITSSLELGYLNEAIDLYNTALVLCGIREDCNTCNSCHKYKFKQVNGFFQGLGYGTINNTLILA